MSQTLIITRGRYPGNRMIDPDETTYNEQIIDTNIKSLDSFCKKIVDALERFENASNFQEETKTIASQLKINNFAQLEFEYPFSRYNVTIVTPKFEEQEE